jgi:NitT/TauT family transport system substrate-binding protein
MTSPSHTQRCSRRSFLTGATALGVAPLLGLSRPAAAEPPPEIRKVRFVRTPALCFVPQFLAEELLLLEGFSEVEQVTIETTIPETLVHGADFAMFGGPSLLPPIDAGLPIVTLAGVHVGCWELFAKDDIRGIRGLKGRRIAISAVGGVEHIWLSSIMAYVGMDPRTDIDWVLSGRMGESQRLFIDGKVDSFLAFPPQPQQLHEKKIGNVIVNTTTDRPYSQYFCCMFAGHRDFVQKYPVATKRVLRGILKAADICAQEPERAARYLVAKGYEPRYEIAIQILKSLPYDRWRTSDPADTLRFHGLRLREVGMIKSTPQQLIAQGTDWRFLNELKKELKA